ncbi:hypothetical protein B1L11_43070 [Microbispora sp. GKU 823]|nr:hypothetical protein B1L11_43070 [Microbispora sp. GKU 823]
MTALIVAPTLVAVLLAGVRVVGSMDSLTAYQRTRSAAEYSVHLRDLAEQLALERDLSVWGGTSGRKFNIDGETEVTRAQQRAAVDPLIQQVKADLKNIDADYGTRAVEQAQQLTSRISSLAGIRKNGAPEDYSALIANVLRLHDELGNNDDNAAIVGNLRALSALAHAKEEAALQRATLTRELLERNQTFTTFELQDFLASQSRQQSYLATFYTEAPAAEASRLVTLLGDKDVVNSELTKSWALTLGLQNQSLSRYRGRDRTAQQWFQDSTKAIEQMAAVEGRVSELVQNRARDLQSAEQRNALIAGGLILALLVLVLATTVLIARSMVRPLRRLRAEALDIAGRRLPDIVRQMRESDDPGRESHVQPIAVDSTDEIGEVAQAFDEVHTQAVRLAAEESRLRANVNAMFVNLSRRTQTLVERQISLIDGLERGEEDGRRLADLFKLDHLATRMRRNSENLLVLAGHEPPRKRSQPARLVDVVRASLSEVEDYERVVVRIPRTIAIAGHAANDVVHLLAELVENAIAFSPRNTKVVVSSSPVEGGAVMLGVTDAGIGMSPEELAEINRRLAEPPTIDVSVSRRMGLFVVGRLALRHGIRVQLRRGDGAGVIAMVLFPAQLISNADQPVMPRPSVPAGQTAAGLPARQAFAGPDPLGSAPGGGSFEPWNSGSGAAGGGIGSRRSPMTGENGPGGNVPSGNGLSGVGAGGNGAGGFTAFGAPTADAPPAPAENTYGESAFTEHSGPHSVPGLPRRGPDGDTRRPVFGEQSESSWPPAPAGPSAFPQSGSQSGSQSGPQSGDDRSEHSWPSLPTGPTAFSPSSTGPTGLPQRGPSTGPTGVPAVGFPVEHRADGVLAGEHRAGRGGEHTGARRGLRGLRGRGADVVDRAAAVGGGVAAGAGRGVPADLRLGRVGVVPASLRHRPAGRARGADRRGGGRGEGRRQARREHRGDPEGARFRPRLRVRRRPAGAGREPRRVAIPGRQRLPGRGERPGPPAGRCDRGGLAEAHAEGQPGARLGGRGRPRRRPAPPGLGRGGAQPPVQLPAGCKARPGPDGRGPRRRVG